MTLALNLFSFEQLQLPTRQTKAMPYPLKQSCFIEHSALIIGRLRHALGCEFKPWWWQTLFQTQEQHLRFLRDSIWFIWFDTIIWLSNLSLELWNGKLKIKEIHFFKKSSLIENSDWQAHSRPFRLCRMQSSLRVLKAFVRRSEEINLILSMSLGHIHLLCHKFPTHLHKSKLSPYLSLPT